MSDNPAIFVGREPLVDFIAAATADYVSFLVPPHTSALQLRDLLR